MSDSSSFLPILQAALDRESSVPVWQQLFVAIREATLDGRLQPGQKLPPTRTLARFLGIARNRVSTAYDQLIVEGFLDSKVGAGTYVSPALDDKLLPHEATAARHGDVIISAQARRNLWTARAPTYSPAGPPRPLRPGSVALDEFPTRLWQKTVERVWKEISPTLLSHADPAGYRPLRQAIADRLAENRQISCNPDEIMIVSGVQEALYLAGYVLLNHGDAVCMEDPGYQEAAGVFTLFGSKIVPIEVDQHGLNVSLAARRAPAARLTYTTPSHQFPMGAVMPLARRLQLIQWAAENGSWIIEDDYDSEFRYNSYPISALKGLDSAKRVIHVGSFSDLLYPALRVGYLVIPDTLQEHFVRMRQFMNHGVSLVDQATLFRFIDNGDLEKHIRRMRSLYQRRQRFLLDAIKRYLGNQLILRPSHAGLHVLGRLPVNADDEEVSARLAEAGIEAPPLSAFARNRAPYSGLLLGFASFDRDMITASVQKMANLLPFA